MDAFWKSLEAVKLGSKCESLLNFPLPRLLWNAAPRRHRSLPVQQLEKRRKQRRRELGQEDPGRNSELPCLWVQVSLQPTLCHSQQAGGAHCHGEQRLVSWKLSMEGLRARRTSSIKWPGSTILHDTWTQVVAAPGSSAEAAHCAGHAIWPSCPLLSLVHSTW